MRSIRGATTVKENTREAILQATSELLEAVMEKNGLASEEIIAITFSATRDLDAAYPAVAARSQGIEEASLLCFQEMHVEGSLAMCIRLMMLVDRAAPQSDMQHCYLKGAKVLRPDLAHFSIAIDGPAGAGKSTIAKQLAAELGAVYVDTGAMYRALAYACFIKGADWNDESQVFETLNRSAIDLAYREGAQRIFLDGQDVSEAIRTREMSLGASAVSIHGKVREKMVALQQQLAKAKSVVMDGRDIGTHVLPEADLKVFLTASASERARRRLADLSATGTVASFEEVKEEIEQRDRQDMTRTHAPLVQAEDAVAVDTTSLSIEETAARILELFKTRRD